tara:strand:+ start:643 stop:1332 length:690 start_codon:yes stop_codon:yes gene_type:complete
MKKKIYCLICARKNSKGLKNKNILKFKNSTLIEHTIKQAVSSNYISKIFLSTDSKKILKIAKKNKINIPFVRPKYLSGDKVPELNVWKHFSSYLKKINDIPDYIIILPITSPLREKQDISNAIRKINNKNYDVIFSLTKSSKNPYFNIVKIYNGKIKPVVKSKKKIFRRQDAPQCYDITTILYLVRYKYLIKCKNIYNTNKMNYIIVPKKRSIDIDTKFEYELVKSISN